MIHYPAFFVNINLLISISPDEKVLPQPGVAKHSPSQTAVRKRETHIRNKPHHPQKKSDQANQSTMPRKGTTIRQSTMPRKGITISQSTVPRKGITANKHSA